MMFTYKTCSIAKRFNLFPQRSPKFLALSQMGFSTNFKNLKENNPTAKPDSQISGMFFFVIFNNPF